MYYKIMDSKDAQKHPDSSVENREKRESKSASTVNNILLLFKKVSKGKMA